MNTVSRSRVSSFMESLPDDLPTMDENGRAQAKEVIEKTPLSHSDIQSASRTQDQEFLEEIKKKVNQRHVDTGKTLHEAVTEGITTIPELCHYLGLSENSSIEDIVYHSHAHQRLNGQGRPQSGLITD